VTGYYPNSTLARYTVVLQAVHNIGVQGVFAVEEELEGLSVVEWDMAVDPDVLAAVNTEVEAGREPVRVVAVLGLDDIRSTSHLEILHHSTYTLAVIDSPRLVGEEEVDVAYSQSFRKTSFVCGPDS